MMYWLQVVLIIVWVLMMWIGVIYAIRRAWKPYLESKREPKERIGAKIKQRVGLQEVNPLEWTPEMVEKSLVFECEDGVEREFSVPDRIIDRVEIGDDGTLVYQGELFIDFEAHRPRHDLDELYGQWTRG